MSKPNVILICVDEWRGDCLSSDGHPYVQTPHLDDLARNGVRFSKGYSATPSCVPARAALFTGQSQERHGRVGYNDGVPFHAVHPVTLQGEFRKGGYHTQAIGKMHVWPERSRLDFDDVVLHDGYLHHARQEHQQNFAKFDDYVPWLRRQPGMGPDAEYFDHGVNCNSIVARPWDKAENLHPTHWIGTQAIEWMHRRDPAKPFFLYLSFHRPHPPYDPPSWAFEQYLNVPPYEAVEGNWEQHWNEHRQDGNYQASYGKIPDHVVHRARAGYYGLMAQIDLQVNRIKESLADFGLHDNTVIAFTSDHGEMMGDHHMFRKAVPYEGSARVPFIISNSPSAQQAARGTVVDHVVELRDIMPTLLDLAGLPIPDSVDGESLARLVRGENTEAVRDVLHGEHVYWGQNLHWLTDGHHKYIWGSGEGTEELFNLDADPQERYNLAEAPDCLGELLTWRQRMVETLRDREEGYVIDGALTPGAPVVAMLRHAREKAATATP
ncbi:arylsulfatase [Paenarthrobacter nitroguajacolicus]|uniref:arylsulfatase n=1 Tax=Paenarthrobacter nitroguajacolicus TaxID=211146 RepID=UPI00248A9E32|nr:arylsulfatase [Paenarthrobacter nitroguajacolicus]MDI2036290.1 Arylsulfatase [Paenarthrobacter nitroguajacolicus]